MTHVQTSLHLPSERSIYAANRVYLLAFNHIFIFLFSIVSPVEKYVISESKKKILYLCNVQYLQIHVFTFNEFTGFYVENPTKPVVRATLLLWNTT